MKNGLTEALLRIFTNDKIQVVLKRVWRSTTYTDAIIEHYTNHVASQTGASPADVRKEIDELYRKYADQNHFDIE
jgi:hypothetical protein